MSKQEIGDIAISICLVAVTSIIAVLSLLIVFLVLGLIWAIIKE